jgi:5-methyltetrahydropteroyltriglutamate--homocysteine methyltransferase
MAGGVRHEPPFRAEHIGSLVRPARLVQARKDFEAGRMDHGALRAMEDEAIRAVVRMQEDIGLPVVTDGEYRRGTYSESFTTQGIRGISVVLTEEDGWKSSQTHGHRMARRIPRVVSRIEWSGPEHAKDFAFLQSLTERVGKFTVPGPGYIHYRAGRQNISRDIYPDIDDFWTDLVHAYHEEMRALREAGCRYLQIDETSLVKLGDPKVRQLLAERGDDWQDLLRIYIEAINAVVAGAPGDMSIGVHLCRSQDASWQANTSYEPISEAMFQKMNVKTYFLEFDDSRSGTFEPLRDVPPGKMVVLGLVAPQDPVVESVDSLKRRIEEAARYLPLEQLALSPQCGFATSAEGGIPEDAQRQKLARVVETARRVWG